MTVLPSSGNKFIENLTQGVKLKFPQSTGYSVQNLKDVAKCTARYLDSKFVQQVVA
ncbi:hypothetical protein H8702_10195 [Massilimaliae timonensis]|uniref:Uncharacterized protein n=1 Tax=Massiliimalia timonensis TaxID=1987501 RepID=A0A8J6TXN1_9FIRM|nr:hypothetical protein [Massiliimalia timonensis]